MVSGLITTKGKNIALDRLFNGGTYSQVSYYQLGMCSKIAAITDTKCYAPIPIDTTGNETIDACDATTGWSVSGDATGVSLDTTAGNRLEGTGSLDLEATYSTGTATYYRTVGSFDITSDYLFAGFYINDLTQLTNTTNTFTVDVGTGGFTDINTYTFNYNQLQTGWNAIVLDGDNPDSTSGAGATLNDIDSIRVNIKINSDLATDDIIMDWIHTYPKVNTFDTFDTGYPTFTEGSKLVSYRFSINSLETNEYYIREVGIFDNTKTYLYRRDNITNINKDQYITVTYDWTDKVI